MKEQRPTEPTTGENPTIQSVKKPPARNEDEELMLKVFDERMRLNRQGDLGDVVRGC